MAENKVVLSDVPNNLDPYTALFLNSLKVIIQDLIDRVEALEDA